MALSAKNAKLGLRKRTGTNKKGGTYTAYIFKCGDYESPLIFPSKLECAYLDDFIGEDAHKEFKKGKEGDGSLDDLDDDD